MPSIQNCVSVDVPVRPAAGVEEVWKTSEFRFDGMCVHYRFFDPVHVVGSFLLSEVKRKSRTGTDRGVNRIYF